ncbi:MAG: hypothetical protein WBE53_26365, partial [Pseudolabrys sp.]
MSKFSRSILKKLARELLCLIQSEKLTQASLGTLSKHKPQYFPPAGLRRRPLAGSCASKSSKDRRCLCNRKRLATVC